jgi:hypothetical protein
MKDFRPMTFSPLDGQISSKKATLEAIERGIM